MNSPRPIALMFTVTGVLMAAGLCPGAIAQPIDPPSDPLPVDSTSASDLTIPAWGGIGHTSSSGAWDGVTRFEGFIPLDQTPGETLTFFAPWFLVDNDGHVGATLLVGHRFYTAERDRIFGGYLAFDHRKTDDSDFSQLGLGLESLGRVWDFRLNTYIPLGDSRQLAEEDQRDSGVQLATQFQGNQLLLSSRREQQITRVYETALFGLDAEVGVTLARWRNGGALRAFAGGYFYDAEEVDATLGWRLRMEARPNQNLTLGLALQDDDLFGTNVVASIGLILPRNRPPGPIGEPELVQARLGEAIVRQPTIAIDVDTDTEIRIEETTEPLRNPEEEEAYRFVHVALGVTGGDGTFEQPFGTVQQALEASISDGNTIVYVDAGTNPAIPAFTIPDRVRVLSQAPDQFLAGLPFPGFPEAAARLPFSPIVNYDDGILVRLPFSGDGRFPTIQDASAQDLVTMGDRTVLSGFILTDAPRNAVVANTAVNVEIRDNTINNAAGAGIVLDNVTGSVVLFDNTISESRGGINSGQGILIRNTIDGTLAATIQRHQLDNNRIGIEIVASGDTVGILNPQQIVNISSTDIEFSREQGLLFTAEQSGNQQISFRSGSITTSGAEGVYARVLNTGSQEIVIEDSLIQGSRSDGILGRAGLLNGSSTAAQELFVRRNRIENNGGNGITIEANELAAQEATIDRNIIQFNQGDGIRGVVNNNGFQEYVIDPNNESLGISNNAIANNTNQGINLDANDSGTLIVELRDNTVSDNLATVPDIEVTANAETNDVCVLATNNTTLDGIGLDSNSAGTPAFFQVADLTSLSIQNTGTVVLSPSPTAFIDRPAIASCLE